MNFLIGFLSEMRKGIPFFSAIAFSFLGVIVWRHFEIDLQIALVCGAIFGYIVGLVVKKQIPNPEQLPR